MNSGNISLMLKILRWLSHGLKIKSKLSMGNTPDKVLHEAALPFPASPLTTPFILTMRIYFRISHCTMISHLWHSSLPECSFLYCLPSELQAFKYKCFLPQKTFLNFTKQSLPCHIWWSYNVFHWPYHTVDHWTRQGVGVLTPGGWKSAYNLSQSSTYMDS